MSYKGSALHVDPMCMGLGPHWGTSIDLPGTTPVLRLVLSPVLTDLKLFKPKIHR